VKPVATVVAITIAMMVTVLLALPLTGPAQAATGPAATSDDGPLSLRLTGIDPRVVTDDGPATLTVVGTLTNTGDVTVDELEIRVQRGLPLGTEGAIRDALDGSAGTDAVLPRFVPLPGVLAPGAELPVRLAVPLRGPADSTLALNTAGVHELMVNVNGVPVGGARARLAAVRMLLPVLSLPPDSTAPTPQPGPSVDPSPFTLLYPIADPPRRLPTVPGEPTLLTDDELATELAPTGRLGGLVAALAGVPVGSAVRSATCLAVDPDLVQTAAAMRDGYQVLGADGRPTPGTGATVAGQWLDALTAAARGGCVIALPFADADLVALHRGGLDALATSAVVEGRRLLSAQLGTPVLDRVVWPADGVVDERTLDGLGTANGRAVLLSAEGIEQGRTPRRAGVLPIAGAAPAQFAVLADPLLGLAATGPDRSVLSTGAPGGAGSRSAVPASTPAGRSTPLSTQDLIGALAFRARSGPDRSGAPVLLAPPHVWAAEGTGATALLRAVGTMLRAGLLTPRPLDAALTAGPTADAAARPVSYPLRAGGREVARAVADSVRGTGAQIDDLRSAAVPDSGVGLNPDEVLQPLVLGLLRPMSAAWRGRPEAAIAAATLCSGRITDLRASVRVLEPPSPYALGTADAPLLVTIGNGLPFTVRVTLDIASTSGLRVAPIDPQVVPPLGRRQAQVSAQVTRSGQFTVLASVRSPDGQQLGPPSRLRVRSTAYGTITVWLTGSAGVLLVVLAIRRVLRRIRGEPARAPIPGLVPAPRVPEPTAPIPAAVGSSPPDRIPAGTPPSSPPGPAPDGPVPTLDPPRAPAPATRSTTSHRSGDPFPEPAPDTERIPATATIRPEATRPPSGPTLRPIPPSPHPHPPASPVESTTPIRLTRSRPPDPPPPPTR